MKVLIQGGGPAGLVLALSLARRGMEPVVVERAAAGRSDGYAVGLHNNGCAVARALGLMEAFAAHAMPLGATRMYTKTGKLHLQYDYRKVEQAMGDVLAIMREDVQAVLERAACDIDLRHGVTIRALTDHGDHVRAELSDDQTIEADIAIGADGYRSALRRQVFGPDAEFIRPLGYRVAAWKLPLPPDMRSSVEGIAAVDHQATIYDAGKGQGAALVCWRDADPSRLDAAGRRAALTARFGDWPAPIGPAVAGIRDWDAVFMDTVSLVDMPVWSKGRVAVLGDAAWALTFLSGQGTSTAMAGAMVLAEELARHPYPQAFLNWEHRLRPTVARLQKTARTIGGQYVPVSRRGMWLQKWLMPVFLSRPVLRVLSRRMMPPVIRFE